MPEENVNRNGWFWLAPEDFNRWRVFPRAFIVFYFWLCMETAMWFMGLPNPGAAQAAFASAIISAGAAWFGLYVNSGSFNSRSSLPPQPPVAPQPVGRVPGRTTLRERETEVDPGVGEYEIKG